MNASNPRNYEDLEGAAGREVFFRPQRYRPADLTPLALFVRVNCAGQWFEPALVDVAQGGLAAIWSNSDSAPALNDAVIVELIVETPARSNLLFHRGEARVAVLRSGDEGLVLGFALVGSPLDVDALLQLRDLRRWQPAQGGDLGLAASNWQTQGHQEFRAEVASFRLFLEDAREQLGRLEQALPWSVIHGDGPPPDQSLAVPYLAQPGWFPCESHARSALVDRLLTEFVPAVLGHFAAIDNAMRRASPQQMPALKHFSVRHLHELMMPAPLLHRAWSKPLGYPGDFECMNYMYFRPFEGTTLYGKALHLASCAALPASAVRARKDLVKLEILRLVQQGRPDRPVRVASIAAGPSQEVFEILSECKKLPHPMELVLFDQDRAALAFAQRRLAPLVERHGSQLKLVVLQDSIRRLLHDPSLFAALGPFDIVFSSGLFDYLRQDLAAQLTGNLFGHLAEGGRAWIGNMAPHNPARWVFEHHLDWTLLYRTPDQMLEFGRLGAPHAELLVQSDATGLNPYLVVQRN